MSKSRVSSKSNSYESKSNSKESNSNKSMSNSKESNSNESTTYSDEESDSGESTRQDSNDEEMSLRQKNVITTLNEIFIAREYKDIIQDEEKLMATKDDKTIWAFFRIVEKLNVAESHRHVAIMEENNINHLIAVYDGNPTSSVKTVIIKAAQKGLIIETFQTEDLQYNITKHTLVPKHERLPKNEAKEFIKKFGVLIPIILKTDPIARFYDFSKGDIIRVYRRDGISYRIVR